MNNEFTDTELAGERWKAIEGYDGLYEVSDLGRVRSRKSGEWRVMKVVKSSTGYLTVGLLKDGKRKTVSVHRLVAQAFIDNDDESKKYINHIDECKQNNRLWNLEYCTASYNLSYNDLNLRRKNYKRHKIKDIYRPELTIKQNIAIFKKQGIDCSICTVIRLRKDLGLTKTY